MTSITRELNFTYKYNVLEIVSTGIIFLIGLVFASLFSGQLTDFLGIRKMLLICQIFVVLGSFIRLLLVQSIAYIIFSDFLNGIGFSFVLSILSSFTFEYFDSKFRKLVYFILSISFLCGSSLGSLVPDIFLSNKFGYNRSKDSELRSLVCFLLGFNLLLFVFIYYCFKQYSFQENSTLIDTENTLFIEDLGLNQTNSDENDVLKKKTNKTSVLLPWLPELTSKLELSEFQQIDLVKTFYQNSFILFKMEKLRKFVTH